MSIEFGPGITFGSGITVDSIQGFTINSSDFTQYYYGYQIVPNSTSGFTNNGTDGPGQNFYGPNLGTLNGAPSSAKLDELIAYWRANGLTLNSHSYMFNVTWGPGSSPQSDKAVLTLYTGDYAVLDIGTVSTANTDWQTGGRNIYNGPPQSAQGTYNFPATFSLYQPLITSSANWC